MKKITINVPILIPKQLVDSGAVELYASKYAGWTEKIETKDGLIDNEETAQDACIRNIQEMVRKNFEELMVQDGRKQGEKQAKERFERLYAE